MKTLQELEEERGVLIDSVDSLIEDNKLDEAEEKQAEIESLTKKIDLLKIQETNKLKEIARKAAGGETEDLSEKDKEEIKNFSYTKFIREVSQARMQTGGLTGFEKEMGEEAVKEARDLKEDLKGYGIPSLIINPNSSRAHSAGGDLGTTIDEDKRGFIDSLRDKLVLGQLGSQMLTDLEGNIEFDRQTSDVSFSWVAENAGSAETGITSDLVSLSPNRLTGHSIVSNQLLRQSSYDIEQRLRNSMEYGAARAFDLAGINGSGTGSEPEGILNTTGVNSIASGPLSYVNIVAMETAVNVDNALEGTLGYLTNTSVKGDAKTTQKFSATNGVPLMDGIENEMNGYRTGVTNLVPAATVIFGNFRSLIMGQWGGLDIIADPYTLAGTNQIKLTLHMLGDVAVEHPESFATFVIS